MEKEYICQSCGRKITSPEQFGTHGDGHRNEDYCICCYKDGLFLCRSMDEQIKRNTSQNGLAKFNADSKLNLTEVEAIHTLMEHLLTLKRWMKEEDKASWVLSRCGYVTLSTIDEDGFPRPVAVDVIANDGIRNIWMTSYRSSEKVRHIKRNRKAGLSFVREADSVSLTGIAEIITESDILLQYWKDFFIHYYPNGLDDENYCLIRFSAKKAKLWIDGTTSRISF